MSSSGLSFDVLGISGKSDGTFGKLEKSSSWAGADGVDVDDDGDIFDLGNGFGALKFWNNNENVDQ